MSMLFHLVTLGLPVLMLFQQDLILLWSILFIGTCIAAALFFDGAHLGGQPRPKWLRFSLLVSFVVPSLWSILGLLLFALAPMPMTVCIVSYAVAIVALQWKGRRARSATSASQGPEDKESSATTS